MNKVTRYILWIGLVAAIIITSVLIYRGVYRYVNRLVLAGFGITTGESPQFSSGTSTPAVSTDPDSTPIKQQNPNLPKSEPTLTAWDGVGRVTILLLGLDYRDWASGTDYSRSDTMILLTLDPLARTAGILSIPRDLWVSIPQFKHGKINTAYYLGDAYKLPGGGAGLAVETVEQLLGVPINYYAQIDFAAFVEFIDEIGGVKIDVDEPITIDLLGGGAATKKRLKAGVQVLPGEWALAYARARYTEGGDFDRARRQQQVILGIRNQILSFELLPKLIGKADILFEKLSSGIHTNLSLDEAIKLAVFASQIQEEHIKQGVIGKESVIFGTSPDGLSILIPVIDKVHVLRDDIFTTSGALSPQTPGDSQEKMVAENGRVMIINSSTDPNLGERTSAYLESLGVTVVGVRSEGASTLSGLTNYTGKPYTMNYLVELMNIQPMRIELELDVETPYDIELILGNDWARTNPMVNQ